MYIPLWGLALIVVGVTIISFVAGLYYYDSVNYEDEEDDDDEDNEDDEEDEEEYDESVIDLDDSSVTIEGNDSSLRYNKKRFSF